MQPRGRRKRDRYARLRLAKNLLLGAQVGTVLTLAAYLVYQSGFSLEPLFVPLDRVLHLLLLTLVAVSIQAMVFRGLEIKYAHREGQRYVLAETSWRRAKKAAVVGLLVAALLLTPPVKALALNLLSPPSQRSLNGGESYPLSFPNQDLLGITETGTLWVLVHNGGLRVTVSDGSIVVNPGGTTLATGDSDTIPLPTEGYRTLQVTFENLEANVTTTFSYRVTLGLPPAFTTLVVAVSLVLAVANVGWLAYLRSRRPSRAGAGGPAWGPGSFDPSEGSGARPWYERDDVWTPVYSPWRPFPPASSEGRAATTATALQELPPPPPQLELYETERLPPPPEDAQPDPARSLLREMAVDVEAVLAKARDRVAAGEYQEALEDYETVLHLDPGHLEALLRKAALLERLQRSQEALDALDRVLARDPYHHEALLRKGAFLEGQGRVDEALDCYETILRGGPAYLEALVRKGDILAAADEAELAWDAYAEALRLSPGDPELEERIRAVEGARGDPLERARREREAGNLERAERLLRLAAEGEQRETALRELADLLLDAGRTQEALTVLDEAILEAPRDGALLLRRAWVLSETGRLADALDACEGACELDPESAYGWGLKGSLEMRLDLRDRARESLQRALELDPEDAESARLLTDLEQATAEERALVDALREVEGIPEPVVAALAAEYGSLDRLKKAKVRALADRDEVDEPLAKAILKRVRKGR